MSIETDLQAVIDRYVDAYNRHDLAAIGAIFTDTASLYSPYGPPAVGHAAIMQAHTDWFAANEQNKRMTVISAQATGDLAYCVLHYAGDFPDEFRHPDHRKRRVGERAETAGRRALETSCHQPDQRYARPRLTTRAPCRTVAIRAGHAHIRGNPTGA